MIDSQPSASPPRDTRAPGRRQKVVRRSAGTRPDGSEISRWKIQLELAPSEIAFVYRKGLTRGAEVCRRGTHEWRPLVTTPELRDALASRASLAEMLEAAPAMTLSQTLAINDPTLAALFLSRRAPQLPKSAPPPPPAIARSVAPPPVVPLAGRAVLPKRLATSEPPLMAFTTTADTIPPPPRAPRLESFSDTEDTPPLPLRIAPLLPARLARALSERKIVHARPFELSVVAGLAIVATLLVTAITLRIEAPRMNALVASVTHSEPNLAVEAHSVSAPAAAPASTIPVVPVVDLPVEAGHGAVLANLAPSYAAPGSHAASASARTPSAPSDGPDRAALARALGGAAAAARSCGEGPVSAQVVVTYAGSGVARNIHFASAPPVAMRSCVLNAVARSRVAPFSGEPITVSKTLRW